MRHALIYMSQFKVTQILHELLHINICTKLLINNEVITMLQYNIPQMQHPVGSFHYLQKRTPGLSTMLAACGLNFYMPPT